ncbi:hypothetical protein ARMGADRAFT_1034136 [Armillaria gallica]|uniref:Uncharacterized protein n=1 Tax=Armillaria gallica TaxID=47427 RepID=A0A2H3D344_ARMGA|nr:hypothetical protein ARMGADRAFT_1034136 [Armillaria gallica]
MFCMSPKQVSRRQSPSRVFCCFITALSFTVIVPTVWITAALWLRSVGDLNYVADSDIENTDRSLVLFVKLVAANIHDSTMVAEWSVEKDTCSSNSNCTEVEIFFDMYLSPSDPRYGGGPHNKNALTSPISVWNTTMTGTHQGKDAQSFRTRLNLSASDNYEDYHSGHSYENSLIYYPFDRYETNISAFAKDTSTNESVILEFSSGSGFIVDHRFAIVLAGRTRQEETNRIFDMDLCLQRNTLVIVYCLVITFTFWLLTLMICLIMIATVVFGFRQRNEIVVVPIGMVFAFTQLRSSMPGIPDGFVHPGNTIDFVGLLPCLILLSISAIAMVGIYLFADPDDPYRRTFTWNELEKALLHYSKRILTTCKECVWRARFCILKARWIWKRTPHKVEISFVNTASENPV